MNKELNTMPQRELRRLGENAVNGWVRYVIDSKARDVRPRQYSEPQAMGASDFVFDPDDLAGARVVEATLGRMRGEGRDVRGLRDLLIEVHYRGRSVEEAGRRFGAALCGFPAGWLMRVALREFYARCGRRVLEERL